MKQSDIDKMLSELAPLPASKKKLPSEKKQKKLAILDFETDSFKHGRVPRPFAADLYDGEKHHIFWGRDCVEQLNDFLTEAKETYIIYAHNGGKFDFFFLLVQGLLKSPIRIINGRLTKATIAQHELRDSYAILPMPLSAYKKDETDYSWFEEGEYQKHEEAITDYLKSDCVYLYDLVHAFRERFGDKLTIGSTAIEKLRELHPFESINEMTDTKIRPFYFGGRVECFAYGVIEKHLKVYDVNSMYPSVMKNFNHPCGFSYTHAYYDKQIKPNGDLIGKDKDKVYFVHFTGSNKGALPVRAKWGLDFNQSYGEFWACSHEIKVALKHNLIKIDTIHEILIANESINFGEFVDTYHAERRKCKANKDKIGEIFAKLILNSSYGKTGQNPDSYKDYMIRFRGEKLPDLNEWDLFADYGDFEIWEKPVKMKTYFDVAIAASVTSAARSILLEAIHNTEGLVYCDTDSLICESFNGQEDESELGKWKLEAEGDNMAIAGKKLYALFDKNNECVKLATKGVRLTANEIVSVAKGERVVWANDAPSFSLLGETNFIKRSIQMIKRERQENEYSTK